ncbi:MAG: 1,3-beta-glucanase [Ktedonobacteraceae bacterium]|nr:1,3-beta-glucanase [Ktedonobacteraceae bacterium]
MRLRKHTDNNDISSTNQQKYPLFRKVSLLGMSALFIIFSGVLTFVSFNNPQKAHAATWTQIFNEDFNGAGGTGLNTANWKYDTGTGWGTGEIENMTNSTANVQQDGSGHLKITALRDGSGNWTSGRIETQRADFAAPVGGQLQVTATVQQPNVTGAAAAGYWPAFWMLGSQFRVDGNWPNDGEIDILEDINGLSSVFGTLHCGVDPGGPCNETTGIGSGQHACGGCQTSFHTYSVIVDRSVSPEQIRWYLDGANYFTVSANQVPAATWAAAVDHGFFIIFDLAMGGGFPNAFGGGPTAATQSGASMLVDNVQAYTSGGSTGGTTPTPTTTVPTPTPTSTGSGFSQGASSTGANQAQLWFKPNGWTAGYVIAHYTVAGGGQQNINMSYNSGTSRWEYSIGGLNTGNVISYSFTYQQNGLQYDSGSYNYTFGGSAPTPTPIPNGSFGQGVNNTGGNQAQFWFQPSGWTAGYVIVHYTVNGANQQNITMSYNGGNSRWEYTAGGISAGNTANYSFTYQRGGLQYDSGSYSWTHP